ncbi:MAG: homoserine kinase [Alphaproteobacteria bacterium]|nr:homoserine kinase [Alphaproteobacteria bacterium]
MAVFTEVSESEIDALLEQYDIGTRTKFTPIAAGIDNTNYFLDTTQGQFVFTLFEIRVNAQDLPFVFGFMEHLQEWGIHCPVIARTKAGDCTALLNGRSCSILSLMRGTILQIKDYTIPNIESAARFLAAMHRASVGYKGDLPNSMSLDEWKKLLGELGDLPEKIESGLTAYLKNKLEQITQEWPKDLPLGVVHADYFPDNLFFEGKDVTGIIDFYFTCTDFYLYDLALAYNAFCFLDGHYMPERAGHFMEAYQSVRKFTDDELKYSKLMAQAAAFRILVTRLHHYLIPRAQSHGVQKDPREYLKILRFHEQN